MRIPGVREALFKLERRLMDTPAAYLAGFCVAVIRKRAN